MPRKSTNKVLIIGSGISGTRLAQIIKKLRKEVFFYQHSSASSCPDGYKIITSLATLPEFQACFVASPTSTHLQYARESVSSKVPCFIEKPISHNLDGVKTIINDAQKQQIPLMVGFNLRFLPVIEQMRNIVRELGSIQYATFSAGQFLPDWRKGTDYRSYYSAHYDQGGGVALDLIHEVDLALSFFPEFDPEIVISQKLSALDLDVEDYVELISTHAPCVRVQLDYLNRLKHRRYTLVGHSTSLECDIVNQKMLVKTKEQSVHSYTDKTLFNLSTSFETEVATFFSLVEDPAKARYDDRYLGLDALKLALKARKRYVS